MISISSFPYHYQYINYAIQISVHPQEKYFLRRQDGLIPVEGQESPGQCNGAQLCSGALGQAAIQTDHIILHLVSGEGDAPGNSTQPQAKRVQTTIPPGAGQAPTLETQRQRDLPLIKIKVLKQVWQIQLVGEEMLEGQVGVLSAQAFLRVYHQKLLDCHGALPVAFLHMICIWHVICDYPIANSALLLIQSNIIKLQSNHTHITNIIIQKMQAMQKSFPWIYLTMIVLVMVGLYLIIVPLLLFHYNAFSPFPLVIFIIIYHLALFLLIWSMVETIRIDSGRVPIKDSAWKLKVLVNNNAGMTIIIILGRKYCLICHVFKPQRTHHCSACNRCVLNMDHHCPWINCCVGFYNRKAFILMLFYTIVVTLLNVIAIVCSVGTLWPIVQNISIGDVAGLLLIVVALILSIIVMVTISLFLKFHLELILSNYTTLQTLQLKRQGKQFEQIQSPYDIGKYYNWVQVFGRSAIGWWVPSFIGGSGPSGDGVIWPKI